MEACDTSSRDFQESLDAFLVGVVGAEKIRNIYHIVIL